MFSEYMDVEKPLDSMAKKDENDEKRGSPDKNKNGEDLNWKDKMEQKKSSNTKNQINEWVNFLRNSDPNNANPKEQQYTLGSAWSESMESWIWQITEKKIPWFEKVLSDGNKAKVECWDDTFSLDITKENSNWEQETLHITLTNFTEKTNEPNDSTNSMPQISVNWNIKLLDNSLQDSKDIAKIVNSIEHNIIRSEREDVHWNYQVQLEKKEKESKKIDDFRVFLCELQFNPQKNNEEMLIYLTNPNIDFDKNNQDYKGIIIALCRLCSRHNSVIEVIKKLNLWEDKDQDSKQENLKTFTGEESVIEYLSGVSDTELAKIIKTKDKIIELSKEI